MLNIERYKRVLLAKEHELSTRIERIVKSARELSDEEVRDRSDLGVGDEEKGEELKEADTDSSILQQVRDSLRRIEAGTFGRCAADGGPIEEKRLEAVPWAKYCIRHQQKLEQANPPQTPTL